VLQRATDFQRRVQDALGGIDFRQLAEDFQRLPERTRVALINLAMRGWFLDPTHHQFFELARALGDGATDAVELSLINYYTARLGEIEEDVATRFPDRERPIRSAFAAHRRGEYELSVPVLLAQGDGICKERFGNNYFLKENRRPATAAFVDEIAVGSILAAILSPLATALPLSASQRERDESFEGLNRHSVLHGERSDYGTEANSLRAVSFLQYFASVPVVDEDEPTVQAPSPHNANQGAAQ
jgi:hypothetical protein